eukprot:RCo020787
MGCASSTGKSASHATAPQPFKVLSDGTATDNRLSGITGECQPSTGGASSGGKSSVSPKPAKAPAEDPPQPRPAEVPSNEPPGHAGVAAKTSGRGSPPPRPPRVSVDEPPSGNAGSEMVQPPAKTSARGSVS